MERQQLLAMHLGNSNGSEATLSHDHTVSRLSKRKTLRQHHYYDLTMSINGPSTMFGLASWKLHMQCGDIKPFLKYWSPFQVKMIATTTQLCPQNERQWSINDLWPCMLDNAWAVW